MSDRKQDQLRRVLTIVDLLAPLRLGWPITEVRRQLADRMGKDWHPRTIRRDLSTLEELGIVETLQGERYRLSRLSSEPQQTAALLIH